MRYLKIVLAVNGVATLAYAAQNFLLPTSYFLPADAPANALDVVRNVGVAYLALGFIQVGTWRVTDRFAIQLVAAASLVFAAAFAAVALTLTSTGSDLYHQFGVAIGIIWLVFAGLYAALIYRERAVTA